VARADGYLARVPTRTAAVTDLEGAPAPTAARRWSAVASIVLLAAVLVASAVTVAIDVRLLSIHVPLLLVAVLGAWYALTRTGLRRALGVAVCIAAVAGILGVVWDEDIEVLAFLLGRLVAVAVAVSLARFTLGRDLRSMKQRPTPGVAVTPATRGVLIMNMKSGGGKAQQCNLPEECRTRGIEPVVLGSGDDLLRLARDAVDRGADVIGMAGGDGSQALVAAVAAERDVAMVVVPAGTRNHLALDLGLDRDDVVGALDAFGDASERRIDLGEVNGTVFVNNVSLGIYAAIVRSPEYRDAKVETTLSTIPKVLGPDGKSFDLRFVGPDGERHEQAHLILVSNNPYGGDSLDTMASRPRVDTGCLGIVSLELSDDRAASNFLKAVGAGHPERFDGFCSWSAETFEVGSGAAVDLGLDGEAMSMDPPLRFTIRPQQLRVRLAHDAIGYSPAARSLGWRAAGRDLWRTAQGKPIAMGT
jgi:diacylglycerol kinase family enzyme